MKNLYLISFLQLCTLFLNSALYSMDLPPISSSITPSATEPLTIEQREKIEDELKSNSETDWYCQKRFDSVDSTDWWNPIRRFSGDKLTKYEVLTSLCSLDDNKLIHLYKVYGKLQIIRILDIISGNCLVKIDPLQDERNPNLRITEICKISKDQIACVLNGLTSEKKIKIFDTNSGKLIKDIIVEFKGYNHGIEKAICLPDGEMALFINEEYNIAALNTNNLSVSFYVNYILILDLKTGNIVRKINLKIKHDCDIFKEETRSLVKYFDIFTGNEVALNHSVSINSAFCLSDGSILLKADGNNICCIISTKTGKVENRITKFFHDVVALPGNEWSGVIVHLDELVNWTNEKFKFEEIKKVFDENKLLIPDLQNIVCDYLSDQWLEESSKIISLVGHKVNILNKKNILLVWDINKTSVLNVQTNEIKPIPLSDGFTDFCALSDGRIAFGFVDGSVEIWSNQPITQKEESQKDSNCIIC